jgi:hypothetical protein
MPRAAWWGFVAFIACARPLAWGYVDQPPLAPLWVRFSRTTWSTLASIGAVVCSLIALPLLPMRFWHVVTPNAINYDQGEQIGWQPMVGQIAAAHRAASTNGGQVAIFTSNYGEAGAVDRYGGAYGLPAAVSGHNAFWTWGPPRSSTPTVLLVGDQDLDWKPWCGTLTDVGSLSNRHDVTNDEEGQPLVICSGFSADWATIWPLLKHFN